MIGSHRNVLVAFCICGLLSLGLCEIIAAQTIHCTASAEIVAPLSLSKVSDLEFGRVVAGDTDGSIVVDNASQRIASGGAALAPDSGASAAEFSVTGQQGMSFSVTLPQSAQLYCGPHVLIVDKFTHDGGQLSEGTAKMHVGATLHVAARQHIGYYTGDFDVTVAYN